MTSLNLAPEELKQLELLRNRLAQLTSNLSSFRDNVVKSNPLPSSESLHASTSILQRNIQSLQDLVTENADLFQRIAVHPSTNFPGRTQEHVLLQLLRKKPEPEVESWIEQARETARAAGLDESKLASGSGGHNYDDYDEYGLGQEEVPSDPFNEQWADMRDAFQEELQHYVTVQAKKKYTVEEQAVGVENVRTGLKRDLEESDEEDEEEEEEEEEEEGTVGVSSTAAGASTSGSGKPVKHPEQLFWLAARGNFNIPRNIPFESQRTLVQPTKRSAPPR